MKRHYFHLKSWLALPALAIIFGAGMPANAQSAPAQNNGTVQDRDSDVTRQELAEFDQFLDSHREIAQQLQKDPSLANDPDYVTNHPDLQRYLQDHPAIREELKENANGFMKDEAVYERREDGQNDRDGRPGDRDTGRGNDTTRQELAQFDRFLDSHPEIAEELRKNPSLVDKNEFVKDHPALEAFLQNNPGVREELRENPNAFMQEEARYDAREDTRGDRRDDRREADRGEQNQFDRFLDTHRETAEQLRKNPSLISNEEFVTTHPALQTYLQDHPAVRDQIKQNPNGFLQQESGYDHPTGATGRGMADAKTASFGEFLGGHSTISEQLSRDPGLVKNQEFMENHPELREYLEAHPDVREQLMQDPGGFVKSAQQLTKPSNSPRTGKNPTSDPKPNP